MDFSQMASQALASATPVHQSSPIDAIGDKFMAGAEIGGTGLALAYLNARSPGEGKNYHESFGYPTDAIVAGVFIALGLLFNSPHCLRIGLGAGVEVGARYGFSAGIADRKKELAAIKRPEMKVIDGGRQNSLPNSNQTLAERPSNEAFQRA
jgi:hypothetical protein